METINNFEQLTNHLSQQGKRRNVAVVCAEDDSTQYAVARALEEGFINAIFVGCTDAVANSPLFKDKCEHICYVEADDRDEAAQKAVALVREGKADILMKGLINTDNLLHAVLNKETGILPKGNVLTHITASCIPGYPKMLFFTDAAVIPYPTHEQRVEQVRYVAKLCRDFGIEEPKLSLIHCSEKVGGKFFPFTERYAEIIASSKEGKFGPCVVDGPLDLKTSCCKESLLKKGIQSPIEGEADALIFPDIEAGNVFYKTITLFCQAETAGILAGTIAPVVLPSRSDSKICKYCSLALAAINA
jgi:phosphate butyryltransferase